MMSIGSITVRSHDECETHVLIADRHAMFRFGLIRLLRDERPGWTCEEADSVDQLEARVERANLVLLDLSLPGLGGVRGLARLCEPSPRHNFVAVADNDDRVAILECLAAGAQGYMLKSASASQFIRGLEAILDGGIYAPASATVGSIHPPVRQAPKDEDAPQLKQLTGRQQDVFRLLAEGCATKTIARRLDLGVGTVKVHLAAIYRALGAHSRLEAVAKAHRAYALG
jgi:DNA-binding NarL/FixJ family response regulator